MQNKKILWPRVKLNSEKLDFSYLFDYTAPKVSIRESRTEGKGVFAGEPIKKGSVVLLLFGVLHRISTSKMKVPLYGFQISDDISLEPSTEATYMNHSCEPNLYVNDDWALIALKGIGKGEELTIDYGTIDYFDYSFDCRCGSPKCRKKYDGMICTGAEYRAEKGHMFTPYLKEKFGIAHNPPKQ